MPTSLIVEVWNYAVNVGGDCKEDGGGAKALLFKELNASLAIGSQTIREIEGILLEPDISPFPINCVCLLFCLPVLFLRSYSGKSLPPPPPEC